MNIKSLTLITILSLCFFFGFGKFSYGLNKVTQDNISELKILTYLPKNNKSLFISNTKLSKISSHIRKNYKTNQQDKLVIIKDSILAYLGVDFSTNKLEDIYDNELSISTYDNREKDLDDVLITFKIKDKKNIDDILNLTNKIDEPEKLIKIFRENKLNFLKYIYRTNDNYILTSTNKKLIIDALRTSNNSKKEAHYIYLKKIINNLKNTNNILLTKNFKKNELLNNLNYSFTKDDYILTLFDFKDIEIISKSYLINNYKNLDIKSYQKVDKENLLDKENYQITAFNDISSSDKYLNQIKISSFEKSILKELNKKLNKNFLFLVSGANWIILFDKNNLSIDSIKLLEDFNKNSLNNNNNIYTIYSKELLKREGNIIKHIDYKKIFSVESNDLIYISNSLINDKDIDLLSKEIINLKSDSSAKNFLNKKISFKNPYFIQFNNDSYLEKVNYFFKNTLNLSIIEFKAIIKESIPETTPIYYAETNLKLI